jgi:hypothetical protein
VPFRLLSFGIFLSAYFFPQISFCIFLSAIRLAFWPPSPPLSRIFSLTSSHAHTLTRSHSLAYSRARSACTGPRTSVHFRPIRCCVYVCVCVCVLGRAYVEEGKRVWGDT